MAESGRLTLRQWPQIIWLALALGFQPTRRNKLHWASWIVALGLELILVFVLRGGEVYSWEQELTRFLQPAPYRDAIFDSANFLTNTLSVPFLVIFIIVVGLVFALGHRLEAALLVLTFPLHVLAQFPKALIDRPRPSTAFPGIEGIGGYQSFPSGHSEYVISFYGFLTFILVVNLERRWQRVTAVSLCVLFVLTVGLGRVAQGKHWPLDVLASYVLGLGILSGMVWLRRSLIDAIDAIDAETPTPDTTQFA